MSCALTATRGACTPMPAGRGPVRPVRRRGSDQACGTDGRCNGAGACRLYAAGSACGSQTCSGSTVMLGARCDGAGNCAAGASQSCTPYACGGTSCLTTCATNTDCSGGNMCTATSCGKQPPGAACAAGSDCASGICVNNVCCHNACTATCMSCALAGSAGTCTMVSAGGDPLNQCNDQGAGTCGTDGACDGAGGCRLYVSGTTCVAGSCAQSTYTPAQTCNGTGVCQAPSPVACDPYRCGTNAMCLAACSSDGDCVAPNVCISGQCAKKVLGTACASGGECASGLCQQGVCCSSSCTGTCRSCALAASPGTCAPVPAGAESPAQCTDNGATGCGTDGMCDGAGRLPPVCGGHDVRGGDVLGRDVHTRAHVQRHRKLSRGDAQHLRSVPVRNERRLPHVVHRQRRLQGAQHLHQRQLRQETDHGDLRGGQRVQFGLLRTGDLLRGRVHRDLPIVRPGGHSRNLHVGSGRRRSPEPVHRSGHRRLRPGRNLQRQRRLPALRDGDDLRRLELQPAPPSRPPAPATGRAPVRR